MVGKKLKKLGRMFGVDIFLQGSEKYVEMVKKNLGENEYIYFYDYPDGHHPSFFEKYPHLIKYRKDGK